MKGMSKEVAITEVIEEEEDGLKRAEENTVAMDIEVEEVIEAMEEEEDVPMTAEKSIMAMDIGVGEVAEVIEAVEARRQGCEVARLASTMPGSRRIDRQSRELWPTYRLSSYNS
jgi:hypothetical protein